MKVFILLFFVFIAISNASISITNTTPNIPSGDISIGNFFIEATVVNTSDLDLGNSFSFSIPDSLPNMSMDDIDDGKLFVSYEVFDINGSKYKSSPGLRVRITDRNVSVKIVSRLYTVEATIDGNNQKIPLSKGDFIKFTLSASNDTRNVANARFKDVASLSFYSDEIGLIDKSNTISTLARLISIKNPAITLSKSGLGASTNLTLKFKLQGGIPANTRVEIGFPKDFQIKNLANFINNIYINDKFVNKKNHINNQKLSFVIEDEITSEDMELLILGNHIINPIIHNDDPFTLRIFLKGNGYQEIYRGNTPAIEQVYFDDKDSSDDYSAGDRILIKFYNKVLISSFTRKNHLTLENEINGSTLGYLYGFSPTDVDGRYSSDFAITLGNDVNISKGLKVTINKIAVLSKESISPINDISFSIPAYYKGYFNNTIDLQYDKMYAQNEIDMLHNPLSESTPTYSSVNSLKITDVDNTASYTRGDTLDVVFSSRVEAIRILDKNSIHIPFSDTSFGDGFSIELNEDRVLRENFYSKYRIKLGANPKISPNSQFGFLKDKVLSKDGSNALSDVLFSGFPLLIRPNQVSKDISFEDRDKNGAYSSGDRVILKFNQNISSLDVSKITVNNSKNLDANFISTKTTDNGYSSEYSIKIGDNTNIEKGDIVKVAKSSIINMYGVKAGLSTEFMNFNVVDIVIPKVEDITFNYSNMQALITFSTYVYANNVSSIEDNFLIFANGSKKSIKEWAVKYDITDTSSGSKSILIDFDDSFLTKIGSNVFDFIIKTKAIKTKHNITNDRFAKTFYRPTRLAGLIPSAWNLVAIQDNGTDTNIKNIMKTNKVSKIWVFDNGKWHLSNKDIQRGAGFWIIPNEGVQGIENIEGIKAIDDNYKSDSILNNILNHSSETSIPLGSSVADCDKMDDKILISDILYNNTNDKNITIFLFDADNSRWNKNKDILPCEGFLVSTTGNL